MSEVTGLMMRRVGLVPGPRDPGIGTSSLGQMVKMLDELVARFATPVDSQSLTSGLTPGLIKEFGGFLLGSSFSAGGWTHDMAVECDGKLALASPFLRGRSNRASLVVWPFDDSGRIRTGGPAGDCWIETSYLARAAIESTARKATLMAQEREARLLWVAGGWGGQEDFAHAYAEESVGLPMSILPLEHLQDSFLDLADDQPVVLLSTGKTAIPLARILGAQGWIAWAERGPALAQSWGAYGPGLALSMFLDHLGFVSEARKLERWSAELFQSHAEDPVAALIERIQNG